MIPIFSPICEKKIRTKFSCSICLWAKNNTKLPKFGFFGTTQTTKLTQFNFSKIIFPFSRMNFQDYFKKFEFLLSFYKIFGWNLHFWIREMPFYRPLQEFSLLLSTLPQFDIPICMLQYESYFRVNQRWKSNVSVLRKSALNSADSELIFFETALMFFMFSESALKNVKSLKQRFSELIISGTSNRVLWLIR